MTRNIVQLEKYEKPRVLLVDFKPTDVEYLRSKGFAALRGATGVHDQGRFTIPGAFQDFEVVALNCSSGCFTPDDEPTPADDNREDWPDFDEVVRQMWGKGGWAFVFAGDCDTQDFRMIGLRNVGVYGVSGTLSTDWRILTSGMSEHEAMQQERIIPGFKGQTLEFHDSPEGRILHRFSKSTKYRVLTVLDDNYYPNLHGASCDFRALCVDDSSPSKVLAFMLSRTFKSQGETRKGAVVVLPDYGKKNIEIIESFLTEVVPDANPPLFTVAPFGWLKDFQPEPLSKLDQERETVLAELNQRIADIETKKKALAAEYRWLDDLLIGTGVALEESVSRALRLLGFEACEMDRQLDEDDSKREDLRITLPGADLFALGEVKSTKRGADEAFITQLQDHQGRYSRENQCPSPDGILFVNHSYELPPDKRPDRFYRGQKLSTKCYSVGIKAVDTAALHVLCQKYFADPASGPALAQAMLASTFFGVTDALSL